MSVWRYQLGRVQKYLLINMWDTFFKLRVKWFKLKYKYLK